MTELSTPAGSVVSVPRWPDALLRVIHERDRARAWAVRMEQENAELRAALDRLLETAGCGHAWEQDVAAARLACDFCQDVWSAMDLLDRIDNPTREDQP